MKVKIEWRSRWTHPQNSTGWNSDNFVVDSGFNGFDTDSCLDLVCRRNSSLTGSGSASEDVQIGRVSEITDEGEIMLADRPQGNANWP